MENSYFHEALSNFTKDFAYGGAIRHLVDKGYTAERIIREFHYPLSERRKIDVFCRIPGTCRGYGKAV